MAHSEDALAGERAPFSDALLDADRHLEGIGGWLIMMAIGLVLAPFVILTNTVSTNVRILTTQRYQQFLEGHPALHGMILFEIITNFIFVAVLAGLNYLFFKKKRSFPTFMILYLAFQLVVTIADTVLAYVVLPSVASSSPSIVRLLRSILPVCLWIPYLLRSRRVKVTFVE
jgi:Protein of unknown function (DUF2569)